MDLGSTLDLNLSHVQTRRNSIRASQARRASGSSAFADAVAAAALANKRGATTDPEASKDPEAAGSDDEDLMVSCVLFRRPVHRLFSLWASLSSVLGNKLWYGRICHRSRWRRAGRCRRGGEQRRRLIVSVIVVSDRCRVNSQLVCRRNFIRNKK